MKKVVAICLLITSLFQMSACSNKNKQVLVTSYPTEYITKRIAGDKIDVKMISEGDTIQVSTIKSDYKSLVNNSDILFYINGLEPYYDIYNDEIRETNIKLVDLASKSSYYEFARYNTNYNNDNPNAEKEAYYHGDVFDSIDTYKNDPMVWMDATALIGTAESIRDYLINAYPDYENDFRKNYNELKSDLALLDSEYQGLKQLNNVGFVSLTPSFGDLQRAYGVKVYPLCLSKFGVLPTEAQLEIIEQDIKNANIKYIAYEPNMSTEMKLLYDQVKSELNLTEIELSNVSLLSNQELNNNADYLTIMYDNLKVLESIGE